MPDQDVHCSLQPCVALGIQNVAGEVKIQAREAGWTLCKPQPFQGPVLSSGDIGAVFEQIAQWEVPLDVVLLQQCHS